MAPFLDRTPWLMDVVHDTSPWLSARRAWLNRSVNDLANSGGWLRTATGRPAVWPCKSNFLVRIVFTVRTARAS
jgi:hypothetical protein